MKKNEKRLILVFIIIIFIFIFTIYLIRKENTKIEKTPEIANEAKNEVVEEFVQVMDDGMKVNTSTKLHETKDLDGLRIGNIQLTHINGISVILADVENLSDKSTDLIEIILTLYDIEGNKLVAIPGVIEPLEPNGKAQLNIGATADYANAYDFKVQKK